MHILLTVAEGEVLVEFPRVLSGAQHRRRLSVMRSARERNIAQFLLKISAVKSLRSKSF
jgi:hypothetical protein